MAGDGAERELEPRLAAIAQRLTNLRDSEAILSEAASSGDEAVKGLIRSVADVFGARGYLQYRRVARIT